MNPFKKAIILIVSYSLLVLTYFGYQWIKGLGEYSQRPYSSDIVEISNSLDKLYFSEPYVYQMFRGPLKVKNIRNSCGIFEFEKPHSNGFLRDTDEGTFSSYDGQTISGYYFITFNEDKEDESQLGVIYHLRKDTENIDWSENYLTFYMNAPLNVKDKVSFEYDYYPSNHLLQLSEIDYTYYDALKPYEEKQTVWFDEDVEEKAKFTDDMTKEKFISFYKNNQIEAKITSQVDMLFEELDSCSTLKGEYKKVDWSTIEIIGLEDLLK